MTAFPAIALAPREETVSLVHLCISRVEHIALDRVSTQKCIRWMNNFLGFFFLVLFCLGRWFFLRFKLGISRKNLLITKYI